MWPRCWMSIVSFFQEYDACYVDLRRSVATDAFFLTTKEMFDRCRQVSPLPFLIPVYSLKRRRKTTSPILDGTATVAGSHGIAKMAADGFDSRQNGD